MLLDSEVHEHHANNKANDFIAFDHKLYALGKDSDGNIALYKIKVEEYYQSKSEQNNKRLHNLKYIEKVAEASPGRTFGKNHSGGTVKRNSTTTYTVSDLHALVKQYDKELRPKPVHPSMLNADGTPKVFHHTTNSGFTAFRKGKRSGLGGKGIYFSGCPM